jgi:H+/Cl- antiporter ClcA
MNMRHFAMPRHHLASGLLIGALAGVAGIGFHFLVDRFGALLFGWIETNQAPISLPLVILVPTIGLCLVGLILQKVPASTLGGVREVSQALDNKYPPAKPEVLRLLAPQRGLTAIAKSKPKTDKTTNGRLPELSNFGSPPAEPGVYHD